MRFRQGHSIGSPSRATGRAGYTEVDLGYTSSCWRWNGHPNNYGYCVVLVDGAVVMAHRWMFERVAGPIPDGFQLDHLCHGWGCHGGVTCPHRACVNPAHLEPVTLAENVRRGHALRQLRAAA